MAYKASEQNVGWMDRVGEWIPLRLLRWCCRQSNSEEHVVKIIFITCTRKKFNLISYLIGGLNFEHMTTPPLPHSGNARRKAFFFC